MIETVFGVPGALGTVSAAEQETSAALASAHAEVAAHVPAAPRKQVEETGWKQSGRLCWLWTAVTVGVYRRPLCWTPLKREFEELLCFTAEVFPWWYRVRDGTLSRASLRTSLDEQRSWRRELLARGAVCGGAKAEALCLGLLEWEPALWAFVRVEGVEPTTNAAERALRPAVLWRKRSQGRRRDAGCRFVERMLTAVQTLRGQRRHVLAYLHEAITAPRDGLPAPKLLPTG